MSWDASRFRTARPSMNLDRLYEPQHLWNQVSADDAWNSLVRIGGCYVDDVFMQEEELMMDDDRAAFVERWFGMDEDDLL